MPFTISIIGRPNVGKSTLYNRLTKTRHAIVHDMPGVTRDRREGKCIINHEPCILIDTPGLEEAEEGKLENRMMQQTELAVNSSDICLMLIDGRAGVTPTDIFFANWLRKKGKNIILAVNKCEGNRGQNGFSDAFKLGFGEVIAISAEHNEGISDLTDAIKTYQKKQKEKTQLEEDESEENKPLQLAIIGRPNTGKSTFLNKLYGSERVLTGPEAGLTRDSIAVDLEILGKQIKLIDTAGMRKKANVVRQVEKMSVSDSLHSIRFCHVAILMLDATQALEKQDLSLADLVEKEGRAIVIVLNKWDLVEDQDAVIKEVRHTLNIKMQQIKNAPIITISATQGKNILNVIKSTFGVYETWNKRITTAKLNTWLKEAESQHIPPLGNNGRRIRLKYITQGNTRPPTFTLFVNNQKDLPKSYKRYLINSLRDTFNLPGVPIRLMVRGNDNPYKDEE